MSFSEEYKKVKASIMARQAPPQTEQDSIVEPAHAESIAENTPVVLHLVQEDSGWGTFRDCLLVLCAVALFVLGSIANDWFKFVGSPEYYDWKERTTIGARRDK